MITIAHLTSAHQRNDIRIFLKECRSLSRAGYETHLVVADGLGDEINQGVSVHDVGKLSGRLNRMAKSAYRVFRRALKIDADVYHIHDPELLPYALVLKARGKKVVFDSHENLPAQVMGKYYLKPAFRRIVASVVWFAEHFITSKVDAVIGATPDIAEKFQKAGVQRAVEINNFPLMGELESPPGTKSVRECVCYVGGISAIRGIVEVVTAMDYRQTDTRLKLAGGFAPKSLRDDVARLAGWHRVDELGMVNRIQVRKVLASSVAGIVTFLPVPNHVSAQPNKMFEYMSAGLPVIASDFPLWREIIAGNDCGLLVDPEDPQAIADAIDTLVNNRDMARRMGENGARAVREKYNWDIEEKKLLALYEDVVGAPSGRA